MPTTTSPTQQLKRLPQVRRVRGQAGDLYELIFLDQQDRIIVPLTEWYRLRKDKDRRAREVPTSLAFSLTSRSS